MTSNALSPHREAKPQITIGLPVMHAVLITASPSERSRSAALLDAAGLALDRAGVASSWLALRELPPEALLGARTGTPELAAALAQVASATAIVFATPIYKGAYSGLLKVFLDLLPQDGLRGRWVWPLATGGSPAHTLALDHSLRPVLDNLGAHQVLPSVFALDTQVVPHADGGLATRIDPTVQLRIDAGAGRLAAALDAHSHLRERAQARTDAALRDTVRCSA
jgi:FMN reductase